MFRRAIHTRKGHMYTGKEVKEAFACVGRGSAEPRLSNPDPSVT